MSRVHIERPTESDVPALARILRLCFATAPLLAESWVRASGVENQRVIRVDGEIGASALLVPMGQYWGGKAVPMTGIAAVGVPPERRGAGLARQLLGGVLRELRADGVALSALYPSTQAMYRSLGYEQAGYRFRLRVPSATIAEAAKPTHPLPVSAVDPDDERVYDSASRFARRFDGCLDRGPYVNRRIRDDHSVFLVGQESGHVVLGVSRRSDVPRQDVEVHDLAFHSRNAGLRLLQFLGDFGTLALEVSLFGGPNHPLLSLLPSQNYVVEKRDFWMLRILDPGLAFAQRGWRGRGRLRVQVNDEILWDNQRTWLIEADGGEARAIHTEQPADVTMSVGTLAALYAGFWTPSYAQLIGALHGDAAAIATADELFPKAEPWMIDMF